MTQFTIRTKLRKACTKAKHISLQTVSTGLMNVDQGKFRLGKASLKTLVLLGLSTPLSLGLVTSANAAAIISNGTIQMGINDAGELNVPGGTPSSGTGTTAVGLRFVPTNADATSPGCLCEGWGVADASSKISGYANISTDGGARNLDQVSFVADAIRATSVVSVDNALKVTHDYTPATETPFLYKAAVTIDNISKEAIGDLRYRRVMDWDIEPTAFNEFVTIKTSGASNVLGTSDNGFASANPLSAAGKILFTGEAVDSGPVDHGALFDFDFGSLAAGASRTFNIFYGAAPDEAKALAALAAVGADQVYSLGQPNVPGGATTGKPNTFIFGFSGVGETPSKPVPEPLTILGSLAASGFGVALRRKYKIQQKDTAKV